jgi:hypothetical protein
LLARSPPPLGEIEDLLRLANADDDYPQARRLLAEVASARVNEICVCRRDLRRALATRHCPLHRGRGATTPRAAAR